MVNRGRFNTMDGLEFTAALTVSHAPLVQKAAAVICAAGTSQPVILRDSAEGSFPARRAGVTLIRAERNAILREGDGSRLTLAYTDGAADSTLAALLACIGQAGSVQGAGRNHTAVAADPESLSVLALAERLAASDIPVLIGGPTGTGKEVLSRFIHANSPRRDGPFVAVNCAAMPEAMLEALLFGHAKGAFTGATNASEGFFRAADGGTLLLDEIAEMPLALQAKLLRTLQEGEVVPIGSTKPVPINVRVIAAANRDLPTEVAEGRFRPDLYYRLNVFPLMLKPLRERPEDIAPLAFALALRHTAPGRSVPWIEESALVLLRQHGWPGNVRELENVVRRALLLADSPANPEGTIRAEHIHFDGVARLVSPVTVPAATETAPEPMAEAAQPAPQRPGRRLANIVQLSEARAIMEALDACGGNRLATARQLGISERTLRYRLASFREAGLSMTDHRDANAGGQAMLGAAVGGR